MLVPHGILESACENEYEDAAPELIEGRDKEIIIICRSGLRGWNDYELPLFDLEQKELDPDDVDEMLNIDFVSALMHPNRRVIKV